MAMTNKEILMTERILNNIDFDLEINTFAGWKFKGYDVNKGEKALFKTQIWKPCKSKKTDANGEQKNNMYLVNASYFSIKQVTKATQKTA